MVVENLVDFDMTDKTAVCIYPWEKPILEQIHGGAVDEASIDEMCSLKGSIKVEKNVHKRQDGVESEPRGPDPVVDASVRDAGAVGDVRQ